MAVALAVVAHLVSLGGPMARFTSTRHGDSVAHVRGSHTSAACGSFDRTAEANSLLPGEPCVIELSRYEEISDAQLVGRSIVRNRSIVGRLTTEFNALPPVPMGIYGCPDDNGSKVVAILRYGTGQRLRLAITLSGCPVAKRGSVTRSALGSVGDRLISELERLTPSYR